MSTVLFPVSPSVLQLIKDYHLMLLVLVFVLVDTVMLTVVMSLDNSRFTVTTIPNKQDPSPRIRVRQPASSDRCVVCVYSLPPSPPLSTTLGRWY